MDKRVIFVHYARHVIGIGSFPVIVFNQGHTLYWDQVMWIYTGKLVWIPLILSMIYVAFRCGGWREGVWFVLVAGLVALLCDQFSSSVCKPFLNVTVRLAIPIFLRW